MKRITLQVLIGLLTFSAGVGLQTVLFSTPKTLPTPASVQATVPVKEVMAAVEPILPVPTTPVVESKSQQHLILEYDDSRFNPYGTYSIIGTTPRKLSEFGAFSLDFYRTESGETAGESYFWTELPDSTYVEHQVALTFVTEKRLILVTAPTADNYVYRFEGEFLRGKTVSDAPAGKAVLNGTLTKSKNGKKVAEAAIKLQVEVHGC